jgi:hypothetical protein
MKVIEPKPTLVEIKDVPSGMLVRHGNLYWLSTSLDVRQNRIYAVTLTGSQWLSLGTTEVEVVPGHVVIG